VETKPDHSLVRVISLRLGLTCQKADKRGMKIYISHQDWYATRSTSAHGKLQPALSTSQQNASEKWQIALCSDGKYKKLLSSAMTAAKKTAGLLVLPITRSASQLLTLTSYTLPPFYTAQKASLKILQAINKNYFMLLF